MLKSTTFQTKIEDIFKDVIKENNFLLEKVNDYEFELKNKYASIIIYRERYENGVIFMFKENESQKKYSFLEIYNLKKKPKITSSSNIDNLTRNLIWHRNFIENFLEAELLGDFSGFR